MRTNLMKLLLPLVIFFVTTNIYGQSWFVNVSADEYLPTPYCQIVTATFTITNNGTAGNMTGLIEYNPNWFDIVDVSDLPSVVKYEIDDYNHSLTFDAGVIGGSTTFREFEYKLILKPPVTTGSYNIQNKAYFDVNPSNKLNAELSIFAPFEVKPILGNTLVSDIMDQIAIENVWVSLLPLEPLSPNSPEYACNPDFYQSLFIESKLTFDIPEYCLHNDNLQRGIIFMGSGSEIVVEGGAKLLIDGLSIGSCHEMWKGIYVKNGGELILNECIVSNAQFGITAEKGSKISLFGTTFLNNYIGIYVPPDANVVLPSNNVDLYLMNNLFIGIGNMLPPYQFQTGEHTSKPYAGIYVNDVSSMDIPGYVNSENDLEGNFFENMINGIIVKNSSITIGDQSFLNINSDPYEDLESNGIGVCIINGKVTQITGNVIGPAPPVESHFKNCDLGIFCNGGHIDVNGMTMENTGIGIELRNVTDKIINIRQNTIEASRTGILLNQSIPRVTLGLGGRVIDNVITASGLGDHTACIEINNPPLSARWNVHNNFLTIGDGKYAISTTSGAKNSFTNNTIEVEPIIEDDVHGIYILGSKNPLVSCNILRGDIEPEISNFHNSSGIYFEAAHNFRISCNEVYDFRYGIQTSSLNSAPSLLRGNTIGDQWIGLYLGYNAIIGKQEHMGNIWDGTFYEYGAKHEGPPNFVDYSPFYYNSNVNILNGDPKYVPPTISSNATWFFDKPSITFVCGEPVCPDGNGYEQQIANWDSLDLSLVAGNLGFPKFDNSLSWMGRFNLYRRLYNSEVSKPSLLNTYIANQESLNIGKFSNAFDSLENAVIYTGQYDSLLIDFPQKVFSWFAEINYIDSLILIGLNKDSLSNIKGLIYDSIYLAEIDYKLNDSLVGVVLKSKLDNAESYINLISPDSIWEEELQFTLLEYIHFVREGTLQSSTDLYNLALSCPDMYGEAVYHARSLIRIDSLKNYFDDDASCSYLGPRTVNEDKKAVDILVPNPANNFVEIRTGRNITDINVFMVSGEIIEVNFDLSNVSASINTTTLSSGIYFVRVTYDDFTVGVYKLVILK